MFSFNNFENCEDKKIKKTVKFQKKTPSLYNYQISFDKVQKEIYAGNTYLLNLTFSSEIQSNLDLKEIYHLSKSPYKLYFNDEFTVFSPETFIKIKGQKISSNPMKGTIDAGLPEAKERLLSSKKELAEHFTIVDLIRNDLSMIAKNVKVDRFQYIDHIKTNRKELFQMSSEISGELPTNYKESLGDIILKMLPAGSISGAPKQKTLEIIKETELYDRGYYTGIFGIFDGDSLDSGVMIRYIEKTEDGFLYKSGGGITAQSKLDEEYQELIDKIYIPL